MGIEAVIMPWGKFRGELIEEIPSDYLYWLSENCADNSIRDPADYEYRRRTDEYEHWYE